MRPDLVLDDDDKRRRFKHSKIGGRKKSENCKVTSTHYKSNKKQMLYVYGHTAQNLPQPTKPPLAETPDTEEEDTEPRLLGLEDSASKSSIRRSVITEKAPTRAFSWLKAATTAFTFKTLLRHYAKLASTQ